MKPKTLTLALLLLLVTGALIHLLTSPARGAIGYLGLLGGGGSSATNSPPAPTGNDALLLQDSGFLLLQDGGHLELQ